MAADDILDVPAKTDVFLHRFGLMSALELVHDAHPLGAKNIVCLCVVSARMHGSVCCITACLLAHKHVAGQPIRLLPAVTDSCCSKYPDTYRQCRNLAVLRSIVHCVCCRMGLSKRLVCWCLEGAAPLQCCSMLDVL